MSRPCYQQHPCPSLNPCKGLWDNPLNNRRKVTRPLPHLKVIRAWLKTTRTENSLPSRTCRLGRLLLHPVVVQLLLGSVGRLCPPVRATGGTRQAKSADCHPPPEQHPKCLSEHVTGKATGEGSSNHGQLDDVHQLVDDPHLHETDPAKGQGKGWTVSRHRKTNTGD